MLEKYHVSKNLWDEDYTGINSNAIYRPLFVGDGVFTLSTNFKLNNGITDIFLLSGNVSSGISSSTNGAYEGKNITAQSVNGYITIAYRANARPSSGSLPYCKTMLNTGSTALPYQPYGNTWNSIPYHKYGTETDSITSLPAPVIGDGTNATAVIEGNMQQATTPTPTNPVTPSETGERTVNLFNPTTVSNGYYVSDTDGVLRAATNNVASDYIEIEGNTDYYITMLPSGNWGAWYDSDKNYISGITGYNIRKSPANAKYARLTVSRNNNPDYATNFMIAKSSTAIPYEPYGYKLPVLSGGVTTPVYLGEVQSERKIKKLVLTGEENWYVSSSWKKTSTSVFYSVVNDIKSTSVYERYVASSHLPSGSREEIYRNDTELIGVSGSNSLTVRISDTVATTAADFKQWLAAQYTNGTPVCVWYVLATPQTTTLNEPIRKIGEYADIVTTSTIPTTATESTFDVDTTLKPSKVELTYHGWHKYTPKEYENGAWR